MEKRGFLLVSFFLIFLLAFSFVNAEEGAASGQLASKDAKCFDGTWSPESEDYKNKCRAGLLAQPSNAGAESKAPSPKEEIITCYICYDSKDTFLGYNYDILNFSSGGIILNNSCPDNTVSGVKVEPKSSDQYYCEDQIKLDKEILRIKECKTKIESHGKLWKWWNNKNGILNFYSNVCDGYIYELVGATGERFYSTQSAELRNTAFGDITVYIVLNANYRAFVEGSHQTKILGDVYAIIDGVPKKILSNKVLSASWITSLGDDSDRQSFVLALADEKTQSEARKQAETKRSPSTWENIGNWFETLGGKYR